MKKFILRLILGTPRKGENIIAKKPTFTTTIPDNYWNSLNTWMQYIYNRL
jgi:hypothetical protein